MTARRLGKSARSFIEQLESRTLMAVTNPVPPETFSATPLSSTSVELKWTADTVYNAISYRIYRTTQDPTAPADPNNPIVWTQVIGAPVGSIRWIDRTLLPSTQYYYEIKSVTEIGLSDPRPNGGAPVTATTLASDAFAQVDPNTNDLVVRGTTGNDVISITLAAGNVVVTLNGQAPLQFPTGDVPRVQAFGGNGNDMITVGAGLSATVQLMNLNGGNGNDTLVGNDGNDRLDGGNGMDSLVGGDGDDTLIGAAANDRLFGGNGNDLLDAGAGNDRLDGGDGQNTLIGGTGHDQIFAQAGLDSVVGDAKYDTIVFI